MSNATVATSRSFPWWLGLAVVLIPCLYLPTLATRFDFADDGVLVYPAVAPTLDQLPQRIWHQTVHELAYTGPFRPVTWAHWEISATLLGPHDFSRRLERWLWSILATASLVWLLYEFHLHPVAIVLTTALAMWNPYRGEIWLGLGLTEAFAIPYALLGLVFAIRAARSSRPLCWDLASLLCLLAALLTKNTFAALVPAQVFLRLTANGQPLRLALAQQGWRCGCYGLTLLIPLTHFVWLKLHPGPNHYATGFHWAQLPGMVKAVGRAVSYDLMAPGIALALLVLWKSRGNGSVALNRPLITEPCYRLALQAGLLLLVCGIGMYLPIDGLAGRYTIPAVWGADLWLGVLLSALVGAPLLFWRRLAFGLLACGLMVVVFVNLARQEKVKAHNALFWQALEYVEREAPLAARLAWLQTPDGVSPPGLPPPDGVHFRAHLHARGRLDIDLQPVCWDDTREMPAWMLSGGPLQAADHQYRLVRQFSTYYWPGQISFQCFLWERYAPSNDPNPLHAGR